MKLQRAIPSRAISSQTMLARALSVVLTSLMLGATLMSAPVLADDPDITVRQESQRTVKEYRLNGYLYAIEIQPDNGQAYVLLDRQGNGNFERLSSDRIPQPDWVKSR